MSLRADFWCPFNCEPDAARPGFMVEIAQYALGKYGHTVDYQIMPWNRAIKEVRAGKIDGVIAELKSHSPDLIYPAREAALALPRDRLAQRRHPRDNPRLCLRQSP